jgi:alpha-L-fucosidase 2
VLIAAGLVTTGMAALMSQPAPDRSRQPLLLWYDRPAAAFEEALPLGNGRTGSS